MIVDELFEALKNGAEVRSPDTILEEDFGVTDSKEQYKILEELDNIAFFCEGCNWWCEVSERADSDEELCESCAESREE